MRGIASFCVALLLIATAARAEEVKAGDLTITDVWSRASAAKTAGVFLTIRNAGDADRLVSAETKAAAVAQLHATTRSGDVVRMRKIDGVDVPAHGRVALKPGGTHVMLVGLQGPLREGTSFPLTLTFAKAGAVVVTVSVRQAGAVGMGQGMKMDDMGGMKMNGDTQ